MRTLVKKKYEFSLNSNLIIVEPSSMDKYNQVYNVYRNTFPTFDIFNIVCML